MCAYECYVHMYYVECCVYMCVCMYGCGLYMCALHMYVFIMFICVCVHVYGFCAYKCVSEYMCVCVYINDNNLCT